MSASTRHRLLLVSILCVPVLYRLPGLLHGLPDYPAADEPVLIALAVRVIKGEFNPGWFLYPSLYVYLNAVVLLVVHVVHFAGRITGLAATPYTPYWMFFAGARALNLLMGALSIGVVYKIAALVLSKKGALLAAGILALLPLHFVHTMRVVPNTITFLTVALATCYALLFLKKPGNAAYLYLSALWAGFAWGAKYMVPAPAAYLAALWFVCRRREERFLGKRLMSALAITCLTFFISTPFSILSLATFLSSGPVSQHSIYQGGRTGMPLLFYLERLFFFDVTPLLFITALAGLVLMLRNKRAETTVIVAIPGLWFGICCFYSYTVSRQVMTLSIPIAIWAACAVQAISRPVVRRTLLVAALAYPAWQCIVYSYEIARPDIRYQAAQWINTTLPPGSTIGREEYTPFPSDALFTTDYLGIRGVSRLNPDTAAARNYDYLLTSGHALFYNRPKVYHKEIANIEAILANYTLIQTFTLPGTYIRQDISIFMRDRVPTQCESDHQNEG